MSTPTTERIVFGGVALSVGVSRNNVMYTARNLAEAVENSIDAIAEDRLLMRSHHDAGDDSLRVVGKVTELRLSDDGQDLLFEAEMFATANARDIAELAAPPHPVLAVSIQGVFLDDQEPVSTSVFEGPRTKHRGRLSTRQGPTRTGSNLVITRLDFTATPGVPTARVTHMARNVVDTNTGIDSSGNVHRERFGTDEEWAEVMEDWYHRHPVPEVGIIEEARVTSVISHLLDKQGSATVSETITRHRDDQLRATIDRAIAARLADVALAGATVTETTAHVPEVAPAPAWEQVMASVLDTTETARQLAALDVNDFHGLGAAYFASRHPIPASEPEPNGWHDTWAQLRRRAMGEQ